MFSAALPTAFGPMDLALSAAGVTETMVGELPPPTSKSMAPVKASRGRSKQFRGQRTHPTARSTWYTVTVGYQVRIFQGRDTVTPFVLNVDGAIYLPHPSHAAACTYYANAMANNEVEIVLTDNEDDG
ncbi:hypothetical protein EDD18DRAFT_1360516 [Armillaria luteobubalina]|uniref:Uncharacterized protein n=1 Tax=Armillaria luteobubalina TaxID=153913 RepID=A0AA39UP22_9AGAR|nr:hypothetical protein EDD18DRAFT_1360516 [Armillaria luteobubalina]